MIHSSPNTSTRSDIDSESAVNSHLSRPTLPPISSYESWPPLSNTTSILSPSMASTSTNSITMSPLGRHLYDPWSPRNDEAQPRTYSPRIDEYQPKNWSSLNEENQSRTEYFSTLSPPLSYQRPHPSFSQYSPHHYRQHSAPQLTSLVKGPIESKMAPIRDNREPLEFILTLNNSPGDIQSDINQVIGNCHSLSDNMDDQKQAIINNDVTSPWLDDMIKKANEILNALLRLRKHQLASIQKDGWYASTSASTNVIVTTRTKKRGKKRPVFQGRCHSCNISETPEWRRGPDGARTLCNACGLYYAKLNKKKNKQDQEGQFKDDTSMK